MSATGRTARDAGASSAPGETSSPPIEVRATFRDRKTLLAVILGVIVAIGGAGVAWARHIQTQIDGLRDGRLWTDYRVCMMAKVLKIDDVPCPERPR